MTQRLKRLRVLVVDDSITVRNYLCDLLGTDPDITVVGAAEDGRQAIELCMALRPDVISLDMNLPVMSGLAATEYIMAYCPTPILVVSSSFNRGDLFKTYEAITAGAVEFMEKTSGDDTEGEWDRQYIALLKLVARVKVVTHLRGRGSVMRSAAPEQTVPVIAPANRHALRLIAIGASTGGPAAIVSVLRGLPVDFPLPVLVVIHIGESFGASFAQWLDTQTVHPVLLATEGQQLNRPGVFLAPGNRHMTVQDHRLHISDGPERHSCRPSVDVLFESIALEYGATTAACLLTGMGQDGALGLLALRRAGAFTVAQDEASCVVYGMPREAALMGAAQHILPLQDIGRALAETVGRPGGERYE